MAYQTEDDDIYEHIRDYQRTKSKRSDNLPPHHPEMLYFGCFDARLDPVQDFGIRQGRALIYRNMGGRVPASGDPKSLNPEAVARGEIPEWVSVGAALDFFINHIEPPLDRSGKPKMKHIVVSGHAPCGGFHACTHDVATPEDKYLSQYLKAMLAPLQRIMERITGWEKPDRQHALEEESVRQSLEHLRSYDVVKQAEKDGRVQLHGWLLNTRENRDIMELQKDGSFALLNPPDTHASLEGEPRSKGVSDRLPPLY